MDAPLFPGLPVILFPCRFQMKACLVMLLAIFLRVWLIQLFFLHLICDNSFLVCSFAQNLIDCRLRLVDSENSIHTAVEENLVFRLCCTCHFPSLEFRECCTCHFPSLEFRECCTCHFPSLEFKECCTCRFPKAESTWSERNNDLVRKDLMICLEKSNLYSAILHARV